MEAVTTHETSLSKAETEISCDSHETMSCSDIHRFFQQEVDLTICNVLNLWISKASFSKLEKLLHIIIIITP